MSLLIANCADGTCREVLIEAGKPIKEAQKAGTVRLASDYIEQ